MSCSFKLFSVVFNFFLFFYLILKFLTFSCFKSQLSFPDLQGKCKSRYKKISTKKRSENSRNEKKMKRNKQGKGKRKDKRNELKKNNKKEKGVKCRKIERKMGEEGRKDIWRNGQQCNNVSACMSITLSTVRTQLLIILSEQLYLLFIKQLFLDQKEVVFSGYFSLFAL